jgi:hypothetical protein
MLRTKYIPTPTNQNDASHFVNAQNDIIALAAWSSGILSEEIGAMGREFESRQGKGRLVALKSNK